MISLENEYKFDKEEPMLISIYKMYYINFAAFWCLFTFAVIIAYKTDKNYLLAVATLLFAEYWSYVSHYLTHTDRFKFIGFLHLFHHDPLYQDSLWVPIVEALLNFFLYGGFILIFLEIYIEKTFEIRVFNNYVIFFWAILYSTYHMLNFHYLKSPTHKEHHLKNGKINYGPDWLDIIFGTKTHMNEFENFNSSVINGFISICIVLLLKNSNWDPIKWLN